MEKPLCIKESSATVLTVTTNNINCILNDLKPITEGETSLQGLRVIWKMYEAEAQNTVADLRGLGLDERFCDKPLCKFDCDSEEAVY